MFRPFPIVDRKARGLKPSFLFAVVVCFTKGMTVEKPRGFRQRELCGKGQSSAGQYSSQRLVRRQLGASAKQLRLITPDVAAFETFLLARVGPDLARSRALTFSLGSSLCLLARRGAANRWIDAGSLGYPPFFIPVTPRYSGLNTVSEQYCTPQKYTLETILRSNIQIARLSANVCERLWCCMLFQLAQQKVNFSADQDGKSGKVEPHIQSNSGT